MDWHEIYRHFMPNSEKSSRKTSDDTAEKQKKEAGEEEESADCWQIVLLKLLVWLTLLIIFIRLQFGVIYFIISLFYLIWTNLGTRRQRHQLSAYSVFNPHFEKIQGTFSAEDYDRQLRRGGSPLL